MTQFMVCFQHFSVTILDGGGFAGLEDSTVELGGEGFMLDKGIEFSRPSLLTPEEVAKRVVRSCV